MIPHPGESAELDWANVTTGAPFADSGDAIRYRAGSATVTAGDVFVAGFYDSRYLEAGADVVFAVAIETLAGSSGTLRLSGGPDAAWSLEDAAASAYPLGDHAVTGAGTLVVALPWVTVADYLTEAVETAVRVECLSGSVVVQQVKLRIWPPTGALGGWSDEVPAAPYPSTFSVATGFRVAPDLAGGHSITDPGRDDYDVAMQELAADARADLAAATTATVSGATASTSAIAGPMSNGARGQSLFTDPYSGVDAGAQVHAERAQVARVRPAFDPPGVEGVDWIVPPDEVPGEPLNVDTTGDYAYSWVDGTATVVTDSDVAPGGPNPGSLYVTQEGTDTQLQPGSTAWTTVPVGTPVVTAPPAGQHAYTFVLLETDSRHITLGFSHDANFAEQPIAYSTTGFASTGGNFFEVWAGTFAGNDPAAEFTPATYNVTLPPYRYWVPSATVEEPHRLIQRTDALGMGSGRLIGSTTRQGSTALLGTY